MVTNNLAVENREVAVTCLDEAARAVGYPEALENYGRSCFVDDGHDRIGGLAVKGGLCAGGALVWNILASGKSAADDHLLGESER